MNSTYMLRKALAADVVSMELRIRDKAREIHGHSTKDAFVVHVDDDATCRKKAAGWTLTYGLTDTPFGRIVAARCPEGIYSILFAPHDACDEALISMASMGVPMKDYVRDDAMAKAVMEDYLAGRPAEHRFYLNSRTTDADVVCALLRLPFGHVVCYEQLASLTRYPSALRRQATMVGRNPFVLLAACHRVIHKDGTLGHYRDGDDRKKMIILWERAKINY